MAVVLVAHSARRAGRITEKFAQEIVALPKKQRQTIFPAFSVTRPSNALGLFLAIDNNHGKEKAMTYCILEVTDQDETLIPTFISYSDMRGII